MNSPICQVALSELTFDGLTALRVPHLLLFVDLVVDASICAYQFRAHRSDMEVLSQLFGRFCITRHTCRKDNIAQLRQELFEVNKTLQLASEMQRKIVENVEVTPEEVREFFFSIPIKMDL